MPTTMCPCIMTRWSGGREAVGYPHTQGHYRIPLTTRPGCAGGILLNYWLCYTVVRIHASSGTTGQPITASYTPGAA